jgi:uncharacterized protein (TIGR02145 family)
MRTKSLIFVLVIAVVFICLAMTDSNAEYVCGDANSDGAINVSDAVFIINYVFIGGSPAPDPNCCETGCPPIMTDIDGNTYFTIKIGDQCWMAENLGVTHYRNGDPIPNVTDDYQWEILLYADAYCNYMNDENYFPIYGRLYNAWAVTDSRNIAPEGWHVPTDEEWQQLEMYLGMSQLDAGAEDWRGTDEGDKLKETGIVHWNSPNTGATNESVFTALPGGGRHTYGGFWLAGQWGFFWSSTEYSTSSQWCRVLAFDYSQIARIHNSSKCGMSIRCVKDQ